MSRLIGSGALFTLLAAAACGGTTTDDPTAARYLLEDRQARTTGWGLPGADKPGALPVELDENQAVATLASADGHLALDVPEGAVAHVRGGQLELLALDADVRSDRLQIEADDAAAHELATELGATIIPIGGNRWELSGDELYAAAAHVSAAGVIEAMPVGMDDESGVPVAGWSLGAAGGVGNGGALPSTGTSAAALARLQPIGPGDLTCEDPVVGLWVAKSYRPDQRDWHEHVLHIKRKGEQVLIVQQTTHIWPGDKQGGVPPICDGGGPSWAEVTTHGKVTLDGDHLHVWGTALDRSSHTCDGGAPDYNLDSFTGRLDGNTFDSVNNDGALAVNRPYAFHRVSCK